MKLSEFITLMRQRIADEKFMGIITNKELVSYADQAVLMHSKNAILFGNDRMRVWTGLTMGTVALPPDFDSFCGKVPGVILDGKITFYNDVVPPLYYNARFPFLSEFGESDEIQIPYKDLLSILTAACAIALNKNEYDIAQDMGIYQAMGGVAPAPVKDGEEHGSEGE